MDTLAVIDLDGLDELIRALGADGYRVVGPTVRDGAIVLAELSSVDQLPAGWGVSAGPGRYRLFRRDDPLVFGHSAGPQSWKQFLHPPRRTLWTTDGRDGDYRVPDEEPVRYAFLGVRGCDLAAIRVLTGVLAGGKHPDPSVGRRRPFVVAVNCTEPGDLCFCASTGTGPAAGPGYDLALTEQLGDAGHRFLVETGSADGARLLSSVPRRTATVEDETTARAEVAAAADRMGRELPVADLRTLLKDDAGSARWDDIASRCLDCGNCTMVCPTCFCTSTEDVTDLTGEHAERRQRWASCFEPDYSYIHGGSVRTSTASHYRQWLTHKFSSWHDQFGGSGCVGCGRCIAWCPAGIDITAELAGFAADAEERDPDAAR